MRRIVVLLGVVFVACGPAAAPSVTTAPTSAAQASQTPAATARPSTAAPTPTATATAARAEILLRFAPGTNISDIDDITDIISHLKNNPGIIDGFGDEGQITIAYDPRLITVERIRVLLEEMSYKTLPPG